MSMIYECPHCHRPQEAGNQACPHCGAEFDGPVPDDAFVPAGVAPEAVLANGLQHVQAMPEVSPAAAEEMGSESGQPAPPGTMPYLTPPSFVPPPYIAPTTEDQQSYVPPPPRAPSPLPKILLIALPIVLVLVLAVVFFTQSLDSDSGPTFHPLPALSSFGASSPAPAPVASGSPMVLHGSTGATAANPAAQVLLGRWQAKSNDYYVFNADGSGARGTITSGQPEQSFLWSATHNRLMLYGNKTEKLRFSRGPDADTIFLRGADGSYVQYSRAKA